MNRPEQVLRWEASDFDRDNLRAYTGIEYRYTLGAFIPLSTGSDAKFRTIEWLVEGAPLTSSQRRG